MLYYIIGGAVLVVLSIIGLVLWFHKRCTICGSARKSSKIYKFNGAFFCSVHSSCLKRVSDNPLGFSSWTLEEVEDILKILKENEKYKKELTEKLAKQFAEIHWDSMIDGGSLVDKIGEQK